MLSSHTQTEHTDTRQTNINWRIYAGNVSLNGRDTFIEIVYEYKSTISSVENSKRGIATK